MAAVGGRVGFEAVKEMDYGESQHPRMRGIDAATRAFESLYVEAIR